MQVHVQGTKFFSLSVCDHKICQLDLEILTPNCDEVVENSENCHPIASKCLILPMSYKSCFFIGHTHQHLCNSAVCSFNCTCSSSIIRIIEQLQVINLSAIIESNFS